MGRDLLVKLMGHKFGTGVGRSRDRYPAQIDNIGHDCLDVLVKEANRSAQFGQIRRNSWRARGVR
jgi:hypothetical protein